MEALAARQGYKDRETETGITIIFMVLTYNVQTQ